MPQTKKRVWTQEQIQRRNLKQREYQKRIRSTPEGLDKDNAKMRDYMARVRADPEGKERLKATSARYHEKNPEVKPKLRRAWYEKNGRAYYRKWMAEKRLRDPHHYMLSSAKTRAKQKGIPFNITREDCPIPKFCPVLGIPLVTGGGGGFNPNSASLDQIVPGLGYIKGNVRVISYRANSLKKDATPEEIEALAQWYRTEHDRVCRELSG